MAVTTIYRLAEQAMRLIEGGAPSVASSITFNEIKIACGNVINQLLKTDYMNVNAALREVIPNGSCLGLYEDIEVNFQLQYAWKNGGRYYQGFYLSKPQREFTKIDECKAMLKNEFQSYIHSEKKKLENLYLFTENFN